MRHSLYLDWYLHRPKVRFDFCSSGVTRLKYNLTLGEVDLSTNYAHGNPEASELLARRYHVQPENVFISTEGASGQNTRIIRHIAKRSKRRNEERKEKEAYRLDIDALLKGISEKTALLVLTNPHAPSGAISSKTELEEIATIAQEQGFCILCDEIYAEFDRTAAPSIFSIDPEIGIVTTSFTKAYGLGGLKLGVALAEKNRIDGLYKDVVNTVGNSPNIVQLIAAQLLRKDMETLEKHKQKWINLRDKTEKMLREKGLEYFPSEMGITLWVDLPIKDTYRWISEHAIPHYGLAAVPGAFFLFRGSYKLTRSGKIRLGLGNINPDKPELGRAFETLERALKR